MSSEEAKPQLPYLGQLIQALRLVAADFETQVSSLPSFVVVTDEIALTYEEALRVARVYEPGSRWSREKYARFLFLDDFFAKLSGEAHAEFWALDALRTDPRWKEARQIATELLVELGVVYERPILDWIHYVPGAPEETP